MLRIQLPYQLQTLAGCGKEVSLPMPPPPVSLRAALAALETHYPMLQGTVIDHYSGQRRPKVRFFACAEDISLQPLEQPLPEAVCAGEEPLLIVGAISGG